jgi:hypothetical protein
MQDVTINDQGTVVLFVLETEAAWTFVKDVQTEPYQWMWMGNRGFAVDHRMADGLIEGMQADGLVVGW